jgi:hypothetical protein
METLIFYFQMDREILEAMDYAVDTINKRTFVRQINRFWYLLWDTNFNKVELIRIRCKFTVTGFELSVKNLKPEITAKPWLLTDGG